MPMLSVFRGCELLHPVLFRQNGTNHRDQVEALATWTDGSIILAGASSGDWSASNLGARDFTACKLDADGNLLWKWQVAPFPNE